MNDSCIIIIYKINILIFVNSKRLEDWKTGLSRSVVISTISYFYFDVVLLLEKFG